MKIIDINGKERAAVDLKIVYHNNIDAVDGEVIETIPYVQATILGIRSTWVEWYPLDEFKKLNPGVIDGY